MAALSPDFYGASSHVVHNNNDHGFVSPLMSRAESVASDTRSSIVSSMTANVPTYLSSVRPPPEYVSPSSASQAATESQYSTRGSVSDDDDSIDRNGRVAVAEGAIALINAFLDKLLYDFLSTARSTSLLMLKPAVSDVLRKKLARDAIARAQGDLEDLLALQDNDDDDETLHTPKELGRWNLEFVWKRSRLRVMMRSDKSEFDIEDDERHVQQQGLLQDHRLSFSQTTVISLSAEIFLAGVLDYIAEQLLSLASSGAAMRTRRQGVNAKANPGLQGMAHILVQEPDVEKAALNSSMERLWRGWRKSLRTRGLSNVRRASMSVSPALVRRESVAEQTLIEETVPNFPDMNYPEHVLASNIPLPMSAKDVDEIETPWLARDPDEKVPREFTTNGRFGHRVVGSVGNFSYFRPMKQEAEVARPSTSPQPSATPFVDAPGAWPGETPAEEADQPDFEFGRRTTSPIKSPVPPDTPMTQMRLSPVSKQESPQFENSQTSVEEESQEIIRSKTLEEQNNAPDAVPDTSAGALQHENRRDQVRWDEDFNRKSIGDMRSLISEADPRSSEQESVDNGKSELSVDQRDSDMDKLRLEPHERMHTARSYGQDDRFTALQPVLAAGLDKCEESESLASSSPKSPRSASDGYSVPPAPMTQTAQVAPRKADRRPPRLPLSPRIGPAADGSDVSRGPSSPRSFLVNRRFSPSSSPRIHSPRTPTLEPSPPQSGITQPETTRDGDAPHHAGKEAPRALQGLGISRQPSDEFKSLQKGSLSPVLQQRVDEEVSRTRKHSRPGDTSPATPDSRRGSLKQWATESSADMGESSKSPTGLGKITSAAITSPEDFDMMVQSHDTIKYTLTPESARDVPTSAFNPQIKVVQRSRINGSKESISSIVGGRKQPPPINTDLVGPRPSRITPGPASPTTASLPKEKQKQTTKTWKPAVGRQSPKNAKPTSYGQLAREPQVQTNSTRDFADFIRTTGPDKEPDTFVPLLAARSTQSLRSLANSQSPATGRAHSVSGASMGRSTAERENIPPVPALPSNAAAAMNPRRGSPTKGQGTAAMSSGPYLRARGASGSAKAGDSAALIDFIRNGPPERGGNRIPHNVAPSGNVVDDDQTISNDRDPNSSVISQRNVGLSLRTNHRPDTGNSTSAQSMSPSARSSVNSQVRLLPNGSGSSPAAPTAQPAYSPQTTRLNVPGPTLAPGMVERKRHRNKDPYYIDDSEDDDLMTALPQDRRPEESLIDFLRNTEPPSDNAPKPLAAAGQAQAQAMLNRARANSVHSLRAATAASAGSQLPTHTGGKAPPFSPTSANTPISASGALPAPTNRNSQDFDSQSNGQSANPMLRPAHITAQISSAGSIPRNPNRAKVQVRNAGNPRSTARIGAYEDGGTATRDLADFLRSSGPPEPVQPKSIGYDSAPAPVVGISGMKMEKKKGVKFWKKKTYLDMP